MKLRRVVAKLFDECDSVGNFIFAVLCIQKPDPVRVICTEIGFQYINVAVFAEAQALRSAKWTGIASDTFNKKLEEYKTAFEELRDVMNNYQEFLKNAAEHYEQVENRLQEEAGNLRG